MEVGAGLVRLYFCGAVNLIPQSADVPEAIFRERRTTVAFPFLRFLRVSKVWFSMSSQKSD